MLSAMPPLFFDDAAYYTLALIYSYAAARFSPWLSDALAVRQPYASAIAAASHFDAALLVTLFTTEF